MIEVNIQIEDKIWVARLVRVGSHHIQTAMGSLNRLYTSSMRVQFLCEGYEGDIPVQALHGALWLLLKTGFQNRLSELFHSVDFMEGIDIESPSPDDQAGVLAIGVIYFRTSLSIFK